MSSGTRLPFDQALKLAKDLVDELRPAVKRLKVAGSLRRRRPDVGDIEIVVEPELYATNLFEDQEPDINQVLFLARSWGQIVKSGDRMIQVTGVRGIEGFKCELYLVHPPAQWGSILAIRTGPASLNKVAMRLMLARGFKHQNGFVIRTRDRVVQSTQTEEEFFSYAGLERLPPARRDEQARELLARIKRAEAAHQARGSIG